MLCNNLISGAIPVIQVWVRRNLFLLIFLSGCATSEQQDDIAWRTDSGWEKLGPGGGGSTFIPTFSYETPDKFIIRCDMTGSYVTQDGGQSYAQVNFANGASCYAYDPYDPNIIYAGSASLNRSKDGGKTWARIFPRREEIAEERYQDDHASFSIKTIEGSLYDTASRRIGAICIDAAKKGSLYFSMGDYFFYSQDDGESWQRKKLNGRITYLYTNASDLKEEVYIFTSRRIHIFDKSTGEFQERSLPDALQPAFSFTAGVSKQSGESIFYCLHNDTTKIEGDFGLTDLWISRDKAATWEIVTDKVITNEGGPKPSYSMVSCAALDADKAYVVSNRYEEPKGSQRVHWYGALKTADGGKHWEWVWLGGGGSGRYGVKDGVGVSNLNDAWVEEAFSGEYIRLLDAGVYPHNGDVAVVTDWYRIMKTVDGGTTWEEVYSIRQPDNTFVSRGIDVTTTYGIHFDPFDSSHIAISYTDIGYHHSFNSGKSWSRAVNGVPTEWQNTCYWVLFDPDVQGKVWSGWSGMHDFPRGKMMRDPRWKERARGGVCVSTDGGKNWSPSNSGIGDDAPVTSIVMDPSSKPGARTLYASVFNKGVFKSVDDGKTWTMKNNGIENGQGAFELTILPSGTLFLTVTPTPDHSGPDKFFPGAVYKSTDGAETWSKLGPVNVLYPNGLAYDPENENRLYLACWADIDLRDLKGRVASDKTLESDGGIFLSEDGGLTWTSVFDKDQYVYDVSADPRHKGRFYCNTFSQGAYRSDDYGKTWKRIKGYDFHWGHRVVPDSHHPEKVYLTTFGSSVWHGIPIVE